MNTIPANQIQDAYPESYALYSQTRNKTRNGAKQKGLDNLWEVLRRQHVAKSIDFTIATIGSQTQDLGGPTEQTIRNANGADYRAIINAFAKEAGGVTKGALTRPHSEDDALLATIDNQNSRHMFRLRLQENKSLRNENNLLKNLIANEAPPIQVTPPPPPSKVPTLTASKLDAIREFISPKAMKAKGWKVNSYGAIVDALGDEVAPVGLHAALTEIVNASVR